MTPTPEPEPGTNAMTDRFHQVASAVLDSLLAETPEWAGSLGDHRFADRLTDHSAAAEADRAATLTDALGALDEIDDTLLPPGERVDLEMLRTRVTGDLWQLTEARPHAWNPLLRLPDRGLRQLLTGPGPAPEERIHALASRCRQVPVFLETARSSLDSGPGMPRVHVEAAIERVRDLHRMLGAPADEVFAATPSAASSADAARGTACRALAEHLAWLQDRIGTATADPRLGERNYAAWSWYMLDCEISPQTLLTRAESDLIATEEEIADLAAEYEGRPRRRGQTREVLDRLAVQERIGPEAVLPLCRGAAKHLPARVREADLVTVPEAEAEVAEAPHARGGTGLLRCESPAPLSPRGADRAIRIALAPPSAPARPCYHRHMLRALMARQAFPGCALQAAHEARHRGATPVRAALRSDVFIEGWSGYAGEMLAGAGWRGSERPAEPQEPDADAALRLAQTRLRLSDLLDAILDVRVHTGDIDEREAMVLLTERGHQEKHEAAAKWRRAQVTCTGLSARYVGHRELSDLIAELVGERPDAGRRELHDAVLAHGAPPPRHLHALLR